MKIRPLVLMALVLTAMLWGCNIFSPFHSVGGSDDAESLLAEARAALRDGRPQQALQLLDRALELDPDHPQVRYFHAVATVRANNVSFDAFIRMMQETSGGSLAKVNGSGAVAGEVPLFNFTEAELARLLQVFQTVHVDLTPVVEGIVDGTLTAQQFPYADDSFLSCGVAHLVSGFILMLDMDHDPANGFKLDPHVTLKKVEEAYELYYDDPEKSAELIRQEIVAIIGQSYGSLEEGLKCLWHYYNWTTFGRLVKDNVPLPPLPVPAKLKSTPSGEFFRVVHAGLSALYAYACPCS